MLPPSRIIATATSPAMRSRMTVPGPGLTRRVIGSDDGDLDAAGLDLDILGTYAWDGHGYELHVQSTAEVGFRNVQPSYGRRQIDEVGRSFIVLRVFDAEEGERAGKMPVQLGYVGLQIRV